MRKGFFDRIVRPVGAVLVTGAILYFLFGIPAYLLLRDFVQ